MNKRHYFLAIPLALLADFLVLVSMANKMVVHDSSNDTLYKISNFLVVEAIVFFVISYVLFVVVMKVAENVLS